jgi:hypothetical protein
MKFLYGDLNDKERSQIKKNFSQKGGQRYLATSSENPSSQISYRNKRSQVRKRRTTSGSFEIYQILYGQNIFPDRRKIKILMNRWKPLGASVLVFKGIMARYKNRTTAMKKLGEKKTYSQFHGTPRLQKIFDDQMLDWIKNGVLRETPYEDLVYVNPAHLIPKANGKMRLVTDMRVVNSC